MPRKKKASGDQPIGIGLTTKQIKRKKPINTNYLLDIEPITDNQKRLFESDKLRGYEVRICAFLAERFMPYWFQKNTKYTTMPVFFYDIRKDNTKDETY